MGDAYDNALMETINGLYKTECIRTDVFHNGPYKSLTDVALGMTSPIAYELALAIRAAA